MATRSIAVTSCLLLALLAASVQAASYLEQRYQCPHMGIANCTANDGLAFFDGCKTTVCIGWRSAVMNDLSQCRPASGPVELARCQRLSDRLERMLSNSAGSAETLVNCPQFSDLDLCATADLFYNYHDGCNYHLCDGSGGALERTQNTCPDAALPDHFFFCASNFNSAVRSHNSRHACSAQADNADRICKVMWPGYRFGDACYAGSDFICGPGRRLLVRPPPRLCPLAGASESVKCREVAIEVDNLLSETRGFSCPELQYSAICTVSNRGFVYNDGCNLVLCVGEESGLTEGRVCKLPFDESQTAGREFCSRQAALVRRRAAESRRHTTPCVSPAEACGGPGSEGSSYFDGCNFCTCLGNGRSQCLRRGCAGYYGTADEFATYCRTAAYRLE